MYWSLQSSGANMSCPYCCKALANAAICVQLKTVACGAGVISSTTEMWMRVSWWAQASRHHLVARCVSITFDTAPPLAVYTWRGRGTGRRRVGPTLPVVKGSSDTSRPCVSTHAPFPRGIESVIAAGMRYLTAALANDNRCCLALSLLSK